MNLQDRFQIIYDENYRNVLSLCLGYVNGEEDTAKDLAQDIFLKVWENLENFRNESKISTWIYRITVNMCLLNNREKKSFPLKFDIKAEDPADSVIKEKQFLKMYNCINKLNQSNKSIILLELEEVPQTEIAEILGISHVALRTRIHRIKNDLSKCIQL